MAKKLFVIRWRRRTYIPVVTALLLNHIVGSFVLHKHPEAGFTALYIDPGSGLLLWQLLAAAAAGLTFKTRNHINKFFRVLLVGKQLNVNDDKK